MEFHVLQLRVSKYSRQRYAIVLTKKKAVVDLVFESDSTITLLNILNTFVSYHGV